MGSIRHCYLLNRIACAERGETAGRDAWRGKQEAEPGTALPTTFPAYTKLAAAGYTTKEDLDGAWHDDVWATTNELIETASLSQREADAVKAAFALL